MFLVRRLMGMLLCIAILGNGSCRSAASREKARQADWDRSPMREIANHGKVFKGLASKVTRVSCSKKEGVCIFQHIYFEDFPDKGRNTTFELQYAEVTDENPRGRLAEVYLHEEGRALLHGTTAYLRVELPAQEYPANSEQKDLPYPPSYHTDYAQYRGDGSASESELLEAIRSRFALKQIPDNVYLLTMFELYHPDESSYDPLVEIDVIESKSSKPALVHRSAHPLRGNLKAVVRDPDSIPKEERERKGSRALCASGGSKGSGDILICAIGAAVGGPAGLAVIGCLWLLANFRCCGM